MNNFTEWHGNIVGPPGTLYEGGIFHFLIEFKDDHPRYVSTLDTIVNNSIITCDHFSSTID